MMYYTYAHIRPDTGVIFYVGKGSKKRAHSKDNRHKHWHHVVNKNKGKFEVRILNWFNNEDDAMSSEVWQIAKLRPLGLLVNKTDGGEGCSGYIPSEETKNKLRKSHLCRRDIASKKATERFDGPNGEYHRGVLRAAAIEQFNGKNGLMNRNLMRISSSKRFFGPAGDTEKQKCAEFARLGNFARYHGPLGNENRLTTSLSTRGEKHHNSKITESIARQVLDAKGSIKEIALKFKCSYQTVQKIKARYTWKHLKVASSAKD